MHRSSLRPRRALAAGLALSLAASTAAAQEGGPPIDLPPPRPDLPTTDGAKDDAAKNVVLASDGKPAVAGRVPEGTDEGALALWTRVVESVTVEGGEDRGTEAARAFVMNFDVRQRIESGTNNFLARFAYLDVGPGLVRGTILDDSGRERSTTMRGISEGGSLQYHYRKMRGEGVTDGWIRLTKAEYPEDREQADGWAAISYDIARLTRPHSFRIVRLTERRPVASEGDRPAELLVFENDPGVLLPPNDVTGVREGRKQKISELCAGLRWVELVTPDFRDFKDRGTGLSRRGEPAGPKVHRLVFGIDPTTGRSQIVIVAPGADGPLQIPGTVLVQSTDWDLFPPKAAPEDQSWMPGRFFVYETVESPRGAPRPLRFDDRPITDLYTLADVQMDAKLKPSDFLPDD